VSGDGGDTKVIVGHRTHTFVVGGLPKSVRIGDRVSKPAGTLSLQPQSAPGV
jgi:hypothetical protein